MRASLRRADCLVEVHDARISSGATTALHPAGCPPGQQESAPRAPSACTGVPPPPCHRVPQLSRLPPCRPFSQPHQLRHHQPPPGYLLPCQCTVTLLSGAHIPLSGRNPMLQEVLGIRPHILVLNKMDLADSRQQLVSAGAGLAACRSPQGGASNAFACPPQTVVEHLKQQGCSHIVFTDCQRDGNVKKVMGQQPHAEPCSAPEAPEGLLLISQPHGAASLAHCEEVMLAGPEPSSFPAYPRHPILCLAPILCLLLALSSKQAAAASPGTEPQLQPFSMFLCRLFPWLPSWWATAHATTGPR